MQQTQSQYLRIGELAEFTNMSVAFWRKQFRNNKGMKFSRLGKIILVAKSDAQAFLEAQAQVTR